MHLNRLFIPVGGRDQYIYQIDKDENGNVTQKKVMGVVVPYQYKLIIIYVLFFILIKFVSFYSMSLLRMPTNNGQDKVRFT